MNYQTILPSKEFQEFVRLLKRIATLTDDYYVKGDMWVPYQQTTETRPGTHVVRGFYMAPDLSSFVYRCQNLKGIAKALGDIKGKKGTITLIQSPQDIRIELQGISYLLMSRIEEDFPVPQSSFSELLADKDWKDISKEDIALLKNGNILEIVEGDNKVRVAKSLIRLRGVERSDQEAKYKIQYWFQGGIDLGMIQLHVVTDVCECISTYYCVPLIVSDYNL